MDSKQKVTDLLQHATVKDTVIYLPNTDDVLVKSAAEGCVIAAGGVWAGARVKGFSFPSVAGANKALMKLQAGEIPIADIKPAKQPQKAISGPPYVPPSLATDLVVIASVDKHQKILVPQAGNGEILKAVRIACKDAVMCWCDETGKGVEGDLFKKYRDEKTMYFGKDYELLPPNEMFDTILAVPPYEAGRDRQHVYSLYDRLNDGGRLVVVTSSNWAFSDGKENEDFRAWVKEVGAEVEEVPKETFNPNSFGVTSLILTIDK